MPKKLTIEELIASVCAITVLDPYHKPLRDENGVWVDDEFGEPAWVSQELHPRAFKGERPNQIIVSVEDGGHFGDYYGEYRGGDPWIHEAIEEWCQRHGYEADWRDPGSLILYPA